MNSPGNQPVSTWIGEFILLAALWGASFLFMRLGASDFGPLPTAGLRVALATVFLWPIMLRQGHWPALRQHWRPILFAGVINSAIPFALFSWAVLHIATGLTSILNATVPLFGALVAWMWLGDRINRLRWAGLSVLISPVDNNVPHTMTTAQPTIQGVMRSPRKTVPYKTANTGVMKVTASARLGPALAMRRKYRM